MIMASFKVLFDTALKPGGTYFVEDLHYQRNASVTYNVNGRRGRYRISLALQTFSHWHINLTNRRRLPGLHNRTPKGVMNIDCYHDMCAFTKYSCSALIDDPSLLAPHDVQWCKRDGEKRKELSTS